MTDVRTTLARGKSSFRASLSLVPDRKPESLSEDEAITLAKEAFAAARAAQINLVSHLHLTRMLYQPGLVVNHRLLTGMRSAAREQLDLARQVEAELSRALEAMEAVK